MSFDRLAAFLCLEEVDPEGVAWSPSRGCECWVQQEGRGRDEVSAGCQGHTQASEKQGSLFSGRGFGFRLPLGGGARGALWDKEASPEPLV